MSSLVMVLFGNIHYHIKEISRLVIKKGGVGVGEEGGIIIINVNRIQGRDKKKGS